jgi:type III secretion protein Q
MTTLYSSFFDIPACSSEFNTLSKVIGGGRIGGIDGISLRLAMATDNERTSRRLRPIALLLDSVQCAAWVEETAFVAWLEPILPVPDLDSLDSDLHQAAAAWTLAPWLDWCCHHTLSVPTLIALDAPTILNEPAFKLSLTTDGTPRQLDFMLDGFPVSWLEALAHTLQAEPAEQKRTIGTSAMGASEIALVGCVGIARLSITQLRCLRQGDTVMATYAVAPEQGQLLLSVDQLLIQIQRIDTDHFSVERMMENSEENTAGISDTVSLAPESAVADLPMTVIFEVGRMTVSLSRLAQLQAGDVLEADFKATPEIGVRVQGRLIATAQLVRIGTALGAKITALHPPHISSKQPDKISAEQGNSIMHETLSETIDQDPSTVFKT